MSLKEAGDIPCIQENQPEPDPVESAAYLKFGS